MLKLFRIAILLPLMACAQSHYEVLIDSHFSPFMGSELILSLHQTLEQREDGIIPPQETPRRGVIPILGRAAELIVLWDPVNSCADVVQHEVFGHGYRIRSLNTGRVVSYTLGVPQPYGTGGGATNWYAGERMTIGDLQSVNLAGLEAQNILARAVKLKWLSDHRIAPRQSSLYNLSELAPLFYSLVQATPAEEEELSFQSHDIAAYLTTLHALYPEADISLHTLRQQLAYNLIDPMIYYSIGAWWYYVFTGNALGIPMIHIGDLAWLPNLSVQLAPYGIEYYMEHYFLYKERPIYAYLKAGECAGLEYFGAGMHYDELFFQENFSVGFRWDTWYQPNFLVNWTIAEFSEGKRPIHTYASSLKSKWGTSASIVSRMRIQDTLTFFYSDLGYKTKGYLPGFSLKQSPIIRLGISAEF
jgi:hypothetical protein